MIKILTLNECFSSNMGDQAIAAALNNILYNDKWSVTNAYLSHPNMSKLPSFDYASKSPISVQKKNNAVKSFLSIPYWIVKNRTIIAKLIEEHDVFIFGGGQLLNSSKRTYPSGFAVSIFYFTLEIRKHKNKKIIFAGIGSVSKFSTIEKNLYKQAISSADLLLVRDQFSANSIKNIFNCQSIVAPDLAFYNKNRNALISHDNRSNICFFITDYNVVNLYASIKMTRTEYYEFLYNKFKDSSETLPNNVLLAYTTIEDAREAYSFQTYLLSTYNLELPVAKLHNLDDLIALLKESKYVFSGRMHALILAKKYDCNIEVHSISEKLENFEKEYLQRSYESIADELDDKLQYLYNTIETTI